MPQELQHPTTDLSQFDKRVLAVLDHAARVRLCELAHEQGGVTDEEARQRRQRLFVVTGVCAIATTFFSKQRSAGQATLTALTSAAVVAGAAATLPAIFDEDSAPTPKRQPPVAAAPQKPERQISLPRQRARKPEPVPDSGSVPVAEVGEKAEDLESPVEVDLPNPVPEPPDPGPPKTPAEPRKKCLISVDIAPLNRRLGDKLREGVLCRHTTKP